MKRVYIKKEVCMGCHLCEVHCQLAHADTKDPLKAFKRELPPPLPRVRLEERGELALSVRCQHCEEPACVYACLTGALSRDPVTGMVRVDEERCIGCWTCILACPYGVIRQDIRRKKMVKCDLCEGRETPACVDYCPNEALVYTELPETVLSKD
ncbi:MAG: 4Fe-4S dicluster domain-containing protein [Dehalococcoidales bacterium]|nr:4Fe-4S dicluster domain-containing protein [Dehalococcoidales bacterium]